MASKGRVFAFAPFPLVNERLPLLSHFGPKRFEAVIGRRLKEAASVVSMALSVAFPIGHSILRTL